MDKICKNCRWWEDMTKHIGICNKINVCYDRNLSLEENSSAFSIEAHSDDDQGLYAALKTGPNFGCIQFDSK